MARTSSVPVVNNSNMKGQLAAKQELFGLDDRYAVAPVHTRFDRVSWFVWDAEGELIGGRLPIVRQEASREAAMAGLDTDERSTPCTK